MENYIVSARKYRPATFESVVGQKSLTATLKNAIHNNKLAHAYLFCGPRGVGKTTCARIFAKTINCMNPTPSGEACNACESCLSFNEQRSYNIHELDAASNNSVEDIRSLIEQVRIPPQIGKYKVYIIDEVHMLSTSAFNAFLKTLEEPPHHAIFILATTEKHKVLPTILSRCQIYDFSRISINDTVEHLQHVAKQENVKAEPEALNVIAQKADGGMRDALSIFDQVVSFTGGNITYQAVIDNLNVLDYEYYFKITDAVLQGNVGSALLIYNEILNKGFDGQNIVTGLASHFRDLLVCKDAETIVLFEVGDAIKKRYLTFSSRCENQFLYKAIELTNECDLNYRLSKNKRLLVELLLIRLCQLTENVSQTDSNKKKTRIEPIAVNIPSPQPPVQQPTSLNEEKNIVPEPVKPSVITEIPTTPQEKSHKVLPKKTLGISLKNPHGDDPAKETQTTSLPQLDEPFSVEELIVAWNSYSQGLKEKVHLKTTMTNAAPRLIDKHTFEVTVFNQGQKDRLEEDSVSILEYIRSYLKNSQVKMVVRISEESAKQLAYTEQEKYQLMSSRNINLRKLVEEFGLRLD